MATHLISTGDDNKLPEWALPSDTEVARQNNTIEALASPIAVLEGTPAYIEGDSYTQDGSGGDFTTNFGARTLARWNTKTPTNRGVSGTRSDQILMNQVVPNVSGNNPGLVMLSDIMLNDVDSANAGECPPSDTAEAFRAILAYHTSRYVGGLNDNGIFYGAGWTAGATSTAGASVDITVTTNSFWLVVGFSPTAGSLTVKDQTGATLATINTGGYVNSFNGVVKVNTPGGGSVRVAQASGNPKVLGYIIPSANPTSLVWFKPGRVVDSARSTRLAATAAACTPVAALFPTVLPVDVDASWDYTTMLTPDGVHPNPKGKAYITDLIDRAARVAPSWLAALNGIDTTYTPVAASYRGPGATAPSAPAAPAVATSMQLAVTLALPADGGATITSFDIQTSTDNATWTNAAAGVSARQASYTITSGLTQGTSYYVRYRANNAVGAGAWSPASAQVAAGAVPVVFVDDNFTRADNPTSVGSVPSGTLTGTAYTTAPTATAAGISGDKLVWNSSTAFDVTVDTATTDVHVTATLGFVTSGSAIAGATLGSSSASAYLVYRDTDGYVKLKKRTNTAYTAYTALTQSASTVASAVGDTIELLKTGSTITARYNGVQVLTYTDASPLTGTRAGAYQVAGLSSLTHLKIDNAVS